MSISRRDFLRKAGGATVAAAGVAVAAPSIAQAYSHRSVALGFEVEGTSPMVKALAESMKVTKERHSASVFANCAKQLEPGLRKIFQEEYDKFEHQWSELT